MAEDAKGELTIPEERVTSLIREKTKGDPAKEAELTARASVLRPLLISSDRLGLTPDQQQTVRNYARVAGERAKKEAVDLLEQNPVERLDQILYEIGNQFPASNGYTERTKFAWASQNLRRWVQKQQDLIAVEQQQREFDGKASSFDDVFDTLLKEGILESFTQNLSQDLDPVTTEQLLKLAGLLKPDMTLDTLRSSRTWLTLPPGSSRIGGTSLSGSSWACLKTNIPGVGIGVNENKSSLPQKTLRPETVFSIWCDFSPEAMNKILKAPVRASMFDQSAPPATAV